MVEGENPLPRVAFQALHVHAFCECIGNSQKEFSKDEQEASLHCSEDRHTHETPMHRTEHEEWNLQGGQKKMAENSLTCSLKEKGTGVSLSLLCKAGFRHARLV